MRIIHLCASRRPTHQNYTAGWETRHRDRGGGSGWIKLERGKCRFFSLQYIYEGARGKETAKSKEREASFLFLKKI